MTWRDLACAAGVLLTIVAYAGIVEAFAWLAWLVLIAAVLYVVIGGIVVLIIEPRTSRRREVSGPTLPRASSLPSAGGPGQAHRSRTARRRPVHARPLPPEATRRRLPPFWL